MLDRMRRGLIVGGALVVVAALCSASALAARGHGHAKFAAKGGGPGGAQGFGFGFGGPGFGGPGGGGFVIGGPGMRGHGAGGPGMRGHGPGMRGAPGGGLLTGEVLKTAATYLGISLAELQADLKGGKTLAQEATAKGKTAAGLITALTNAAKDNLSAAVAAGWLTQKQADAMLERVTAEATALVNNGPPVPHAKKAGPLDAAATYLGMTVAELKTALKGGKTLAQVAADKSKTVDGLVAALTADAKTKLDKAVADNAITQAQATAILGKLTQKGTNFVNGVHGPKAATTTTNAIKHALRYTVRR